MRGLHSIFLAHLPSLHSCWFNAGCHCHCLMRNRGSDRVPHSHQQQGTKGLWLKSQLHIAFGLCPIVNLK